MPVLSGISVALFLLVISIQIFLNGYWDKSLPQQYVGEVVSVKLGWRRPIEMGKEPLTQAVNKAARWWNMSISPKIRIQVRLLQDPENRVVELPRGIPDEFYGGKIPGEAYYNLKNGSRVRLMLRKGHFGYEWVEGWTMA